MNRGGGRNRGVGVSNENLKKFGVLGSRLNRHHCSFALISRSRHTAGIPLIPLIRAADSGPGLTRVLSDIELELRLFEVVNRRTKELYEFLEENT